MLSAVFQVQVARAQATAGVTPNELDAARSLFADALRDEEAKRFSEALQKFQRVRGVRDTASIEYRIGSCYEGLGRAATAYAAYREAVLLGERGDKSPEVIAAAADRLHALAPRVALLALVSSKAAPPDVEVRVDDAAIDQAALGEPIALEPGRHVVTATAGSRVPFRSEIVLSDGAQVSLTISLESRSAPAQTMSESRSPDRAAVGGTAGWVGVGVGGGLVLSSAVLLLLRQSEISKLDRECPGGACPRGSNRSDLEATRSRAVIEGPLAAALGIGGVVAAGIGAYSLWVGRDTPSRSRAADTQVLPLIATGAGGIAVAGTFR